MNKNRRGHAEWPIRLRLLAWAALLALQGGCGANLEPWHEERLTAEFTARQADEVGNFEGYKRLEDRLFQQLDTQVYKQVETGPEFALVRYSAGSAADPRGRTPDWNRSLELSVDRPAGGVLLLHGMSDSPYTFRALAKALNRRGYWVVGLRLPGHGTAPSGLRTINWRDMAAAVRLAMAHLQSKVGSAPVHIVGYSTGAPLAVDFTLNALAGDASPVPASLILVSPAIGIHPAVALAGLKDALGSLPGMGGLAWAQVLPEFDPYKYNSFATNAGAQVHNLTVSVAGRVAAKAEAGPIEAFPPTLVFKSTVDATVSTAAVINRLMSHLAPNRHELVLFDINRFAAQSTLLIADPGPFTDQVMGDETLPFAVTLVTNEDAKSRTVIGRRKGPFSSWPTAAESLDLDWPVGVVSLSHVALPFPPDDPLYGQRPP